MSLTYITYAQLAKDVAELSAKLPPLSGVVGVPRSGMIPAAMLALQRNAPLSEVRHFIGLNSYFLSGNRHVEQNHGGRILVLDDSIYRGSQMLSVRTIFEAAYSPEAMRGFVFAAVYGSPDTPEDRRADVIGREIPGRRYFEWNLLHHGDAGRFMLDLDGVLCPDPPMDEVTEPDAYRQWILGSLPLNVPTVKVGAICTMRLERWREKTEFWLSTHGIEYDRLIMHPAEEPAERRYGPAYGAWKGRQYQASDCDLFIESDERQAADIHACSDKPAICFTTGKVFANQHGG